MFKILPRAMIATYFLAHHKNGGRTHQRLNLMQLKLLMEVFCDNFALRQKYYLTWIVRKKRRGAKISSSIFLSSLATLLSSGDFLEHCFPLLLYCYYLHYCLFSGRNRRVIYPCSHGLRLVLCFSVLPLRSASSRGFCETDWDFVAEVQTTLIGFE